MCVAFPACVEALKKDHPVYSGTSGSLHMRYNGPMKNGREIQIHISVASESHCTLSIDCARFSSPNACENSV